MTTRVQIPECRAASNWEKHADTHLSTTTTNHENEFQSKYQVQHSRTCSKGARKGPQTDSESGRASTALVGASFKLTLALPDPVPGFDVNRSPTPIVKPMPTCATEHTSEGILAPGLVQLPKTFPLATPTPAATLQSTPKKPTLTGVWNGLEKSLRALHSSTELFPPLQSTIGIFIKCLDVVQQISKNHWHTEREELASELTAMSELMAKHPQQSSSGQMSEAVARVVRGIEEQVKIIESRRNRGSGWRRLEAEAEGEQLNKCYRRIGSLFRQLQVDANLSMWNLINDQMAPP